MAYMIEGQTLTNIADAIREKAGTTSPLYPEQMPSYIRNIQSGTANTDGIPDDIVTEANRVASSIISKMGSNSLTFVALADMHELGDSDSADATVIERFRRATRNAGQGAWLVSQKVALDFSANLGDYCYGSLNASLTTSHHDWSQSIVNAKGYLSQLRDSTLMLEMPGNHDMLHSVKDDGGTYVTNDLITGMTGNYRYVDIEKRKVRVIALNTAEYTNGYSSEGRMSGEQLQWFANSLDLSGKLDAANWGIIILAHHPLDFSGLANAVGVLTAYLNGASYSVTHNGVAVSYNFAGKNVAKVIAQFHGHRHCFKVANIGNTKIQRITIPNACFNRNNEYGDEATTYHKNDNHEGKNTAFCVVSIDLDKRTIYADCFGAGYDRVVSYGDEVITTYSIVNRLTNVKNSNGATVITEGTAYTAVLTANEGYVLDGVTVTMGGTDVTDSVYGNGRISIAAVTGNLVITAVGTQKITYDVTNLVPVSTVVGGTDIFNGTGYKDGCRISGGTGESAASGYVTTGVMPYGADENGAFPTIYIRGATLDLSDSNCRWTGINSNNASRYQVNGGASTAANQFATYFVVDELESQYYSLTPIAGSFDSICAMKMSLKGSGAGLIITVNQPIVSGGDSGGSDSGGGEGGSGSYTNLVSTSLSPLGTGIYNGVGYKDGTYVTGINDGGTDSSCVATGLIRLDADVECIYIKGAAWDTSNGHVRFYVVNGVGASTVSHTIKADGSGSTTLDNFFSVQTLGTNYYKWTLTANGKSALVGKYYCLSLAGKGQGLIVTHDEPIE